MPEFIPGRELSRRFYWEAVRPLLDTYYPSLPHAAALLGPGSEVLGFDTPMSMDHDWYPNVLIFLRDEDAGLTEPLKEMLGQHLPHNFLGFGVDALPSDLEENTRVMAEAVEGPVEHKAIPVTVRRFARLWLDWDMDQPLDAIDWLTLSGQTLRMMTAGAVHYDGVGELTAFRQKLSWYPDDVWLYLLASGWSRIGEEEHLMPRAGYAGDELGSALMGSRLVRDVMSLCFLLEKQYAPYPKWFGTAFHQLGCAQDLAPILWRVQQADSWQERESALGEATAYLARWHNRLGITAPLPESTSSFFGRPFQVIWGGKFAEAIWARITDPEVKRIAEKGLIGNIDQFSDSTPLRSHITWRKYLRRLFEA